jgi:glycosyltransferase involved in cell wall biosynthesis
MAPLVSIGITAFNQAGSVFKAVQQALAQDYPNLEVVVSDDHSKDNTEEILAQFLVDPRFRYSRNERNLGRVRNYQHLLCHLVRGDWVLINDGDDYLTNAKYISQAVTLIQSDPKIVLVISKVFKSGRDDEVMNENWPYSDIVDGTEFFLKHPPGGSSLGPSHLSALYERDSALELDFYRSDIISTDFESLYRLMTGRRIGFINEVAGVWSQHLENVTRNPSRKRLVENLQLFESLYQHAKTNGVADAETLKRWYRACLARAWLSGVKSLALRNRQVGDAATFAYPVLKREPLFWLELPNAIVDITKNQSQQAVPR